MFLRYWHMAIKRHQLISVFPRFSTLGSQAQGQSSEQCDVKKLPSAVFSAGHITFRPLTQILVFTPPVCRPHSSCRYTSHRHATYANYAAFSLGNNLLLVCPRKQVYFILCQPSNFFSISAVTSSACLPLTTGRFPVIPPT